MNQKTQEFRQKIADDFVKALTERQLEWKAGWRSSEMPINVSTGKPYKGINKFRLFFVEVQKQKSGETPENRWATFKQIQEKGWRLRKGARGEQVEYWMPYDAKTRKPISWKEFYAMGEEQQEKVSLIAKYYTVFNGRDIIGIPPLEKHNVIVLTDELINKISKGMEVPIINDGNDRAYYSVAEDKIHLPKKEFFLSGYEYNSTALHELSHASGAEKRLHRDLGNRFGSEEYAYEELVAEISSCFMGEHLEVPETDKHIENHKAYVQSWVQCIQQKPEFLIRAIRDAEEAANYLEYQAGILTYEQYKNVRTSAVEVPENQTDAETKSAPVPKSIDKEMRHNGFKPTPELLGKIDMLDKITGKKHSLKDLAVCQDQEAYRGDASAMKLLKEIRGLLRHQEMLREQIPIR